VRLPGGVAPNDAAFERNGSPLAPTVRDGYAKIGDAKPGDRIVMTFPVATEERAERRHFGEYRLNWRGETVVGMEPQGHRLPLYRRAGQDGDAAPLREWSPSERRDPSFRW
jgi:hypothetical protein